MINLTLGAPEGNLRGFPLWGVVSEHAGPQRVLCCFLSRQPVLNDADQLSVQRPVLAPRQGFHPKVQVSWQPQRRARHLAFA